MLKRIFFLFLTLAWMVAVCGALTFMSTRTVPVWFYFSVLGLILVSGWFAYKNGTEPYISPFKMVLAIGIFEFVVMTLACGNTVIREGEVGISRDSQGTVTILDQGSYQHWPWVPVHSVTVEPRAITGVVRSDNEHVGKVSVHYAAQVRVARNDSPHVADAGGDRWVEKITRDEIAALLLNSPDLGQTDKTAREIRNSLEDKIGQALQSSLAAKHVTLEGFGILFVETQGV